MTSQLGHGRIHPYKVPSTTFNRRSMQCWGQPTLVGCAAALLVRAMSAVFVTAGPVLVFGGGAVVLSVTFVWLFLCLGGVFGPVR